MSIRFANRIVLAIGGNSGIGRAAAQACAEEGAQVVFTTGLDLFVDGGVIEL